MTTIEFRN